MGVRTVFAGAIAVLGACLTAVPAAAATLSLSLSSDSSAPIHVVVGDVINASVPPAGPPPPGFTLMGSLQAPLPFVGSGSAVQRVSAGYDSADTADATFRALQAGTASIVLVGAAPAECGPATGTTTASTVTTPATSKTTRTTGTTTTSTTSVTNSTTTTPLTACVEVDPIGRNFTIVVSAVGSKGTSTGVPNVGSGGSAGVGALLLATGAVVAGTALVGRRVVRHRRRRETLSERGQRGG